MADFSSCVDIGFFTSQRLKLSVHLQQVIEVMLPLCDRLLVEPPELVPALVLPLHYLDLSLSAQLARQGQVSFCGVRQCGVQPAP
jgi:hypothetical protein